MWMLGRLAPDFKTIADFRKDKGPGIKKVCAHFVEVCRKMGLLAKASVAIDGSKFKAVTNRDKNFTRAKVERRRTQLEDSVARYLSQLDTADRHEPSETITLKKTRIKEKLEELKSEMEKLAAIEKQMLASTDEQISLGGHADAYMRPCRIMRCTWKPTGCLLADDERACGKICSDSCSTVDGGPLTPELTASRHFHTTKTPSGLASITSIYAPNWLESRLTHHAPARRADHFQKGSLGFANVTLLVMQNEKRATRQWQIRRDE